MKNLQCNLTMLTDFYELTMANGYLKNGMGERIVVFDMFFREIPDKGGFAIAAGLEQLIEYMNDLSFSDKDIKYLREKGIFSEEFLDYLKNFKFCCDVWSVPEGTPIFPGEPIVTVRGPIIQAQLVETMTLLILNHQCLVATKANRICRAAEGRPIMEFGSRRAQGASAAILGARAAFIGGCSATACTLTDRDYAVPATGTMAHSWVQVFDSEYEAFKCYAESYPDSCTLLVDTYNVLKSGVPNAIKVFDEVLAPMGYRPRAVRIDSGDIAYLSKRTREMLDAAGYTDCKIVASNSLDEYLIRDLIRQGAMVDSFGVGENMITAKSDPVFGGVYKLAAVERDGKLIPTIKISETVGKITTPGFKTFYRFFDNKTGKAMADVIALFDEPAPDTNKPYVIFDPSAVWKRKELTDVTAKAVPVMIFNKGNQVYFSPTLPEIKEYCKKQVETLWDEVLRFEFPHRYYVDLSNELWELKSKMLNDRIF